MAARTRITLCSVALVLLGACSDDDGGGSADTTVPGSVPAAPVDLDAARDYCTSSDGTPEVRQAYWATNLEESSWVALPATLETCRFEADDGSRIYVDLVTLYSEEPTLAAAAYLAKLPLPSTTGGANPAAVMCAQTLQGTGSWGTSASGGGWVNQDDSSFEVIDMCLFSDLSAIDQWGIAYYSGDVVRGTDLADLFRFDADDVPPFFPAPSDG